MGSPSDSSISTRARAAPARSISSCPAAPWPCLCPVRDLGPPAAPDAATPPAPPIGPYMPNRMNETEKPTIDHNGLAHALPHSHDGWHESDGSLSSRCLWNHEVDQGSDLCRPGQSEFNIVQRVSEQLFSFVRDARPHRRVNSVHTDACLWLERADDGGKSRRSFHRELRELARVLNTWHLPRSVRPLHLRFLRAPYRRPRLRRQVRRVTRVGGLTLRRLSGAPHRPRLRDPVQQSRCALRRLSRKARDLLLTGAPVSRSPSHGRACLACAACQASRVLSSAGP